MEKAMKELGKCAAGDLKVAPSVKDFCATIIKLSENAEPFLGLKAKIPTVGVTVGNDCIAADVNLKQLFPSFIGMLELILL